jgi:tetratricopeptide (TPR) repeat protein
MDTTSKLAVLFVASLVAVHAPAPLAQSTGECGNPLVNAFGPFDYRTSTQEQRTLVEAYHFTPSVEALRAGSTGAIGSDIDYTLRAFPNHPRALMAMIRLGQHEKAAKPRGAGYTVECYVERALQFRPDDVNVRQIRGIYLSMQGDHLRAIGDFEAVVQEQPDNANAHYNLGLAYFETKNYGKARAEAKRALELKFPLDGLKRKLQAAGKWDG